MMPLMTDKLEWDWPPTMRPRRRPRVEVLEPEEPRRYRLDRCCDGIDPPAEASTPTWGTGVARYECMMT